MKFRILAIISAIGIAAIMVGPMPAVATGVASGWHLGYYNPSGRALSLASVQAPASGGVATFDFTAVPSTALLITDQKAKNGSLIGDDSLKSLVTAHISITNPTGVFTYYDEPVGSTLLPTVRFFFETGNAGGSDPTHYWWSNPVSLPLATGSKIPLSSAFGVGSGSQWSDYNGQFGGTGAADTASFDAAISHVTAIGLSFGGGSFFENGVSISNGSGTFTLNDFSVVK